MTKKLCSALQCLYNRKSSNTALQFFVSQLPSFFIYKFSNSKKKTRVPNKLLLLQVFKLMGKVPCSNKYGRFEKFDLSTKFFFSGRAKMLSIFFATFTFVCCAFYAFLYICAFPHVALLCFEKPRILWKKKTTEQQSLHLYTSLPLDTLKD